jgi:murein DD-endopeptidase MepM/ murein hydrolase activator NlpD
MFKHLFMAKVKYHYNPETLSFQKIKPNKGKRWLQGAMIFFGFILTMFLGFFILNNFFASPSEKALNREMENLKLNYKILAKKEKQHAERLAELENRDNKIYRQFFEANPIPNEVRKAGFGGVDRYQSLEGFENSKMIIDLSQQMDELSKRIVVQSKSLDEIIKMAEDKEEMLAAIPAIMPVRNEQLGHIASGFGMRFHPILKIHRPHEGIDFVAKAGTPIYASGNGVIAKAERSTSFGNMVKINHGYQYETIYAHLQRSVVRKGQRVKRGDIIGYMGNTGLSVSTHLHYEVHKNGKAVNPVNFFYGNLKPEEFVAIQQAASAEGGQTLD